MYIPDYSLPFIRKFIRTAQSRDIDQACIHHLFRPLLDAFKSDYSAVLLLPNRYISEPQLISNNPPEFVEAYMPVFKKDFLMTNLVETTNITLLSSFSPDFLASNNEFVYTVQKVRPVSDVCYVPLEMNGHLAGYLAIGRAGLHTPKYSPNEVKVFSWLAGFLNNGYCRTLKGGPVCGRTALLDAAGRVLQRGAEIDAVFAEIFGANAREFPAGGKMYSSRRFASWYRVNLHGESPVGDFVFHKGDKTYRLVFRRFDADPVRLYFPREPQAEIVLADRNPIDSIPPEASHTPRYDLTLREEEIVQCIFRGLSNRYIAFSLGISPETVKRHVYNIFKKCDVRSRTELVMKLAVSSF